MRATKLAGPAAPKAREILYYVDPMHPAYKSDKPGVAPDCGMALEPVYADDGTRRDRLSGDGSRCRPPTRSAISPERQQLIGVKFATVELSGHVAIDPDGRQGDVRRDARGARAHAHRRLD